MTEKESLDAQLAWRDLCIAGPKERVDAFLAELDRIAAKQAWHRDSEAEMRLQTRYQTRSELRSYTRALAGYPVQLLLWRRSDQRVDTWLAGAPTAPELQRQALVAEACTAFRAACLAPAALAVGLEVGRHSFGPYSIVPPGIDVSLWRFFDAARFVWPPTDEARSRWQAFALDVFKLRAAFDRAELKQWFTEKGWEPGDVDRLMAQLSADSVALSAAEDALQPA